MSSRQRSTLQIEVLEPRQATTGITGVSLNFGNLAIKAPLTSGNVAIISIDPANKYVQVSLNGQSEEFSPSQVANITYTGGSGGGDTFTNNTNLVSLGYGYGGNNKFTGGSSYNFVYFFGNNNTFTGPAGSINDVYEGGGHGDVILGTGTTHVYAN